jgi:hypothetical protein
MPCPGALGLPFGVWFVAWSGVKSPFESNAGSYPALVHRLAIRLFKVSWCKMACSQLFMPGLDGIEKANENYC